MFNFICWTIFITIVFCVFVVVAGFICQEVVIPFLNFWAKMKDEFNNQQK